MCTVYICILMTMKSMSSGHKFWAHFAQPRRERCPVSGSHGQHDFCPFGVGEATCPMQGFLKKGWQCLERWLGFPLNLAHVLTVAVAFHIGILSDLWDFSAFVPGFSIALICNVVRLLIRQWAIEAWPVEKLPQNMGRYSLTFCRCCQRPDFQSVRTCFCQILFYCVHPRFCLCKVHDLEKLQDPVTEHVLLDTGSRPWKNVDATFTRRQ